MGIPKSLARTREGRKSLSPQLSSKVKIWSLGNGCHPHQPLPLHQHRLLLRLWLQQFPRAAFPQELLHLALQPAHVFLKLGSPRSRFHLTQCLSGGEPQMVTLVQERPSFHHYWEFLHCLLLQPRTMIRHSIQGLLGRAIETVLKKV